MGYYPIFILASLAVLTLVIILLAWVSKKNLNPMQGMIISMYFGMSIGLTAGVLLGVTFQGNLFLSTILSTSIGVFAGLVCGSSFGILSMLEGLMSGLMGGMMGAMLGEMINEDQSIILIRVFLLISITTIFLFVLLANNKNQLVQNSRWLLKPLILAIGIVIYFVGGVSFAEKQYSYIPNAQSQTHTNHSSSVEKNIENASQVITIKTENMKYSQAQIVLENNQPVTLILENQDIVEHDIEIRIPTISGSDLKHNHGNEKNLVHLHAESKSTENLTFTPVGTGVYEFICTIPGHKESGMIGQVIVK